MRKVTRRWLWLLLILPVIAVVGFVIWASITPAPMPKAEAALQSDDLVRVETDTWLQFVPISGEARAGLIFYPGGRVDPRSYAPMAHALAAEGYLAVITFMPLNLAVFGINQADGVIAAHPEIAHWAVGGHSLGGSMAARYVQGAPSKVDGLLLLASYPDVDLSQLALDVVVVYGTRDGLATVEKVEGARSLLPASTEWIEIEGGNHAQFSWYGDQVGDNTAEISHEQQQAQVIDAGISLLKRVAA